LCYNFAGTCVASAELQQSDESLAQTVSMVYGADMIPRLNVDSIVGLMDELSEHGALAKARNWVGSLRSAPPPEPEPEPGDVTAPFVLGGRVLFVAPVGGDGELQETLCWTAPQDFKRLLVHFKMLDHHMPWQYRGALARWLAHNHQEETEGGVSAVTGESEIEREPEVEPEVKDLPGLPLLAG
jgi:hypothetical protein